MTDDRRENQRGRPSLQEVLARLDEEVKLLHTHLGGLPRAVEADHVLRQVWIDDVHNSTAIEGNTMTRAQVENLVERRQASASLAESLEVEGYARAADWVYRNAPDYTGVPARVVSEIHQPVCTRHNRGRIAARHNEVLGLREDARGEVGAYGL